MKENADNFGQLLNYLMQNGVVHANAALKNQEIFDRYVSRYYFTNNDRLEAIRNLLDDNILETPLSKRAVETAIIFFFLDHEFEHKE